MIEIDVVPPADSHYEYSYLDFPLDFEVCHQDLSSNFSLKIHALLCRPYVKGRDWYDFNWYISKNVVPNFSHLQAALYQWGPWEHRDLKVDMQWLRKTLREKVDQIDWQNAAMDVEPFLRPTEQHNLTLWEKKFFQHKISRLIEIPADMGA